MGKEKLISEMRPGEIGFIPYWFIHYYGEGELWQISTHCSVKEIPYGTSTVRIQKYPDKVVVSENTLDRDKIYEDKIPMMDSWDPLPVEIIQTDTIAQRNLS